MTIWTGAALVLLTWVVVLAAAVGTGLVPALLVRRGWAPDVPQLALWWGLGLLVTLIVSVSLAVPLRGSAAAAIVVGFVGLMTGVGVWAARHWRARHGPRQAPRWSWLLTVGLLAGVVYLAVAALGPVTNYDTGLYHLGAIAYAGDHPAIPGLANLYFPFGYSNAQFPVAAFLGNGPWDGVGYRLLNGVLLAAMALDLALRARLRRRGPGFFVLCVSVAALFVPMVALSDYWVTSPTSDSAVFVLTMVSAAYLVDAVADPRRVGPRGSVAVVTAVLAVMLRPTMAVFAAATLAAVLVLAWRFRRVGGLRQSHGPALALAGAFGAVAALVMSARDVVLSGWLQYPLSLVPVDVPWRAADPTQFRVPTLGAARDPQGLWAAAEGWDWVGGWIARLPSQWETYEFALLSLVAVLSLVVAGRVGASLRVRALLLAITPSLLTVAFWWLVTPPSFRFIWGPLFAIAAVPAGWALWCIRRSAGSSSAVRLEWLAVLGVVLPIVLVSAFSAAFRFDATDVTEERTWRLGVSVPYSVAPVADAPVTGLTLPSGLAVLVPTESDQCWANYPLCTAQIAETVRLRGDSLADGFLP